MDQLRDRTEPLCDPAARLSDTLPQGFVEDPLECASCGSAISVRLMRPWTSRIPVKVLDAKSSQ
jgi:hypothetical protein